MVMAAQKWRNAEMLGENIKVHFAGSDGDISVYIPLKIAQVNYRLFSCFKFIKNKKPGDDLTDIKGVLKIEECGSKHVIMDSGLFTLMFGSDKGTVQTKESLTLWQDKLIQFVQQNNLNATCVEIDCQKVLGVEEAWWFRQRMRDKLKNKQINVFHFEDGKNGLDRLIEFSDYIALSIPELRIIKGKTFREDTRYLVNYIKNKKPSIDIHLLGCTDIKMLSENKCCTSADSTSWLTGVRYGSVGVKGKHIRNIKKSEKERYASTIKQEAARYKLELTPSNFERMKNLTVCAKLHRTIYENAAGNQN